jgi:CheY-like chemotaxis protein
LYELRATHLEDQQGLKILFVDDNPIACRTVCKILKPFGHQVVTATSAEEGLDLLKQGPFDLAIVVLYKEKGEDDSTFIDSIEFDI